LYSSYPDLVNAYAEIISGFSRAEQTKMFSGNAERIFRI
jgi:predicted TIM-barrel fold metal-dependent hydrolase